MKPRYLVVYEKTPLHYGAHAPKVPGCASLEDTLEETRASLQEGLCFHLEAVLESGSRLPDTVTTMVDFAEEVPEHGIKRSIIEWLKIQLPTPTELPVLTAAN